MLSEHTASDGSKAHDFSQILRLSWLWFSWDRDRIVHELLEHPPLLNLILQLPGVDGRANQEVFHVLVVASCLGAIRLAALAPFVPRLWELLKGISERWARFRA